MADTAGSPGYRLTSARGALGSCEACGALVALNDQAAVEQHRRWHDSHPGPPAVGGAAFVDRIGPGSAPEVGFATGTGVSPVESTGTDARPA